MEEEKTLTIIDYLEIAWRRKWLIIIPFLVIMPVAIAYCLKLPKIYKASTTVLVIPQKVPDSFIKSTVTMNPSEYLNVISQEIMSRTRLEKIIDELSLFPEQNKKVPIENLISIMRNNIDLDVHSSRSRSVSSFTISYQGKDPQAVMLTANRISSLFIEENLKSRAQQAKRTTVFLSSELGTLKVTLEEQEKIISKFKQRYLGSLPEQRDANLRMLDQLILQRQRITDELNDTENRKFLLQQQLLQSDSLFPIANDEQSVFPAGSFQARISETKRRITQLQNKYTEEHPDVISAKIELKKLLAQSNNRYESNNIQEETGSPFGSEINRQLLALNLGIKTLKNEDRIIKEKISNYQSRVEMAPKLEQELASLTRDYKNTKGAYDELMKKRLEAAQSEKLEITQQGEQFKVLDPAKVPLKPFKPDRLKILLIGLMLSLGLGGGLVFLIEYLDQSFYSVKDIESYLELPVLASIPLASTQNHEKSLHKILSIFL
jgi:polysaccharide chain length determinant protein (PEP-CTERM system associated)